MLNKIAKMESFDSTSPILPLVGITDFNNLPPHCYVSAFTPKTVKIESEVENGLEEKFGGKLPFFVKDEQWPLSQNSVPMAFFGQLMDIRKNDNILYRIFIDISNGTYYDDFFISKIQLNKENLKNQILLKCPDISVESFEVHKIIGWEHHYELKSKEFILDELDINIDDQNKNYNQLHTLYYEHGLFSYTGIKIGGTPFFTQSFDEKMVEKYNFLQLTSQNILSYGWGDCGVAHISEDCDLYMDCC